MKKFVPENFKPQESIKTKHFILKKLSPKYAELDFKAVSSNKKFIRNLGGWDWPGGNITFNSNLKDLHWHQKEFEKKSSFVYTILNLKQTKCIGCVYIYPTDNPYAKAPKDSDADISMWITKKAYNKGLYPILFEFIKKWIKKDWPFTNPYYSNREISK